VITFERMKAAFERLAAHYKVLSPVVAPALPTDPCDFTDPPHVRIKLDQECDRDYQVRHLFGHYLADLHGIEDGRHSDDVADVVARMVEEAHRGFHLAGIEKERAQSWIEQHKKDHPMKHTGAVGGRWSYTFTPTGIGTIVVVRCCACGAEKDVTNYEGW